MASTHVVQGNSCKSKLQLYICGDWANQMTLFMVFQEYFTVGAPSMKL